LNVLNNAADCVPVQYSIRTQNVDLHGPNINQIFKIYVVPPTIMDGSTSQDNLGLKILF